MSNGTDSQFHKLRLIRSARVGPVSYRQLIRRFGSAEAALDALPMLLQKGGSRAVSLAPIDAVQWELDSVHRFGARLIFDDEADFPQILRSVAGAPVVLAVKGQLALLQRTACAIVGARNASASACKMAAFLAQGLAERGFAVVSGLARGIDTAAHRGALSHGTIAVVAGGIDFSYPPENADLQRQISEHGLLIAEMPFGTEPRARHFPHRNRIIAGLAAGTVIVEAAPKSGSLITARLAAEAGREVMAIPGSPMDARSQGCNDLIRQGATLVQSVDDIAEMLTSFTGEARSAALLLDNRASDWIVQPESADADLTELDDTQRGDVRNLLSFNFVDVDELVRQSDCDAASVHLILLEMELAGTLERGAGGKVRLMG